MANRPWYKTVGCGRRSYYTHKFQHAWGPGLKMLVRFPAPTNQQAQTMRRILRNYWWWSCRDAAEYVGLLGPIPLKYIAYAA